MADAFPGHTTYPAGAAAFATAVNADKTDTWAALNEIESWQELAFETIFGNGIADYENDMAVTGVGTGIVTVDTGLAMVHGRPVEFTETETQGVEGPGTNHVYLHQDGSLTVTTSATVPDDAIEIASVAVDAGSLITSVTQTTPTWWLGMETFDFSVPTALPAFTANTTVNIPLYTEDLADSIVQTFWVAASAIPADADGVLTLQLFKRDKAMASDTALNTSAWDVETNLTTAMDGFEITLDASEAARTLQPGDTLYLAMVSNSAAIDTNWGAGVGTVIVRKAAGIA